jgi:hypothetical protein
MSKLLLVIERNGKELISSISKRIDQVTERIIPGIIKPNETLIIQSPGFAFYIFNPVPSLYIHEQSVCLGFMTPEEQEWWVPGSNVPDGSYALFRSNDEQVEVVSDMLASRSVWYYSDSEVFIASTSQRAIIMCLQQFQFNEKVIPWMLFSGITGPDISWDRRIMLLPGNSVLYFNRNTWQKDITTVPFTYTVRKQSYQLYFDQLHELLSGLLTHSQFDSNKWILTLSGGYDSRCLLLYLKEKPGLRTITWGMAGSKDDKDNDAYLAGIIADYYGIPNIYFTTDRSSEDFDTLFNRFLTAGDGRIEHIGGYMDGFHVWSSLFNNKFCGIIRGDHNFGWSPVYNHDDVYNSLNIRTINNYGNTEFLKKLELPEQSFPEYLSPLQDESMPAMRDRLYSLFRVPCFLAALTDIKMPFVEVYNPLLSSKVNRFIHLLPDQLRTDKKLLKDLILARSPNIPFNKHEAILTHSRIVQEPLIARFLIEEISTMADRSVLPKKLLNQVAGRIQQDYTTLQKRSSRIATWHKIRRILPGWTKSMIKRSIPRRDLDFNLLAFRVLIINRMDCLLKHDSRILINR